ncbi:phosphodiester glycosidase family protein [Paracoccus aerodenitrificans]|uniref:phosphodiester glycosidase family protein n=1 Tax=Paracoccus aerodenitrificans TaxID=3017781 RepID=UPI0022F02B84|nr:phosphodiester glycosidase family protein [Paracoccus aerodenitrificans]WBU63298.1 phosphodiester glycosidase family protein [Paracoccus aerodenitrificans]
MTGWTRILCRLGVAAGAVLAFTASAKAADCSRQTHDGQNYVICQIGAQEEPRLRLWLDDATGRKLNGFSNLRSSLPAGETLVFAMNAGMFHRDYEPVGLYKSDAETRGHLVTQGSSGNFGLLPNGVFCAGGSAPYAVFETLDFAETQPDCRIATQSGPMLVIDGDLHPRFLVDSDSRYIRNGVGVSPDGETAWFAISERPVTFHEFGRLFRDGLGARNALYFDGSISRLYAPQMRRNDFGWPMGPIIGLVDEG